MPKKCNIWHLLAGEYPPQPGGVSDYTSALAVGLADLGNEVHVWTKRGFDGRPISNGPVVHRLAENWSPADLKKIDLAISEFSSPRKLLVQYVPNAWGQHGLNFGFCRWLLQRRERGDEIRLMIHEPFYPWRLWDKPTRWVLSAGQRRMMRLLLAASSMVYLSIPGWEPMLRPYEKHGYRPMVWLPIPSNIPVVENQAEIERLRSRLGLATRIVIGSFGTFGELIGDLLIKLLPVLLSGGSNRVGLLLGRAGDLFANKLVARHPYLRDQVIAPGLMSADDISLHLQLCDLLVQPYPDGVSSRRTTVMAGLAHGKPVLTTSGFLTEPLWAQTNCVALHEVEDIVGCNRMAELLISDKNMRRQLGTKAVATYDKYYALERTLSKLQE